MQLLVLVDVVGADDVGVVEGGDGAGLAVEALQGGRVVGLGGRQHLDERASDLKRLCGAGGAVKDSAVEIQGDHRERIADHLRALGYTVKLAGG